MGANRKSKSPNIRGAILGALLLLAPSAAFATQMAIGTGIAPQNVVSHADATLIANAAAAVVLPANLDRVEAICRANPGQTSTNTARIGDSSTAAAIGYPLAVGDSVTLYTTAPVFGFSATGASLNCTESTRP